MCMHLSLDTLMHLVSGYPHCADIVTIHCIVLVQYIDSIAIERRSPNPIPKSNSKSNPNPNNLILTLIL